MQYTLGFSARVRATFMGAGVAALLATAVLTAPVLAADQTSTNTQTTDAIGPHTHQIHGVVKGTPAPSATSFTVTTERYGDVAVSFSGVTVRGHGHGQGRAGSSEVAKASDLTGGNRVVVQGHADGTTFVARRVHRLPATGERTTHVVGSISAVASASNGNTTLTVAPTNGSASQSVTVTSNTKIHPEGKTLADLKVGTKITVVSKNGTASGVVVMPS